MTFQALAQELERSESKHFGHGATEAEVETAETRLGLQIVGGYRQFLRTFGWGGVADLELHGLGADVPPFLDLTRMTLSEREEMGPPLRRTLLPLMNDGGGNLYCLDLASPGEPPVVFWDHEAGATQSPRRVAEDFVSWFGSEARARSSAAAEAENTE